MRNKRNVVKTFYDFAGRPAVEIVRVTRKGNKWFKFRVIGANGEILNDLYASQENAVRGVKDLGDRLLYETDMNS